MGNPVGQLIMLLWYIITLPFTLFSHSSPLSIPLPHSYVCFLSRLCFLPPLCFVCSVLTYTQQSLHLSLTHLLYWFVHSSSVQSLHCAHWSSFLFEWIKPSSISSFFFLAHETCSFFFYCSIILPFSLFLCSSLPNPRLGRLSAILFNGIPEKDNEIAYFQVMSIWFLVPNSKHFSLRNFFLSSESVFQIIEITISTNTSVVCIPTFSLF